MQSQMCSGSGSWTLVHRPHRANFKKKQPGDGSAYSVMRHD